MLEFLSDRCPRHKGERSGNKQRQKSNNKHTYTKQEHVGEQQQHPSLSYCSSLGHLSCCCCFNTWRRRQRVELELIFFFEFLLLRCHFPRSRLCVGVTSVCVGAKFVFGQRLQQLAVHSTRLITHAILLLLFVGPYYIPYYSRLQSYTHTRMHTLARDCALLISAARILK